MRFSVSRFLRVQKQCGLVCHNLLLGLFIAVAVSSNGCDNGDWGADSGVSAAEHQALTIPSNMKLEIGVMEATNTTWSVVGLENSYSSLVVVATPAYTESTVPLVTRIRNVGSGGFEIKLDRFDGQTDAISPTKVHYIAVEEGTYTEAVDGVTMEAVRYTSTVVDRKGSWNAESRAYINTYSNPVVIGQVLTTNDTRPSVFWSRGSSRKNPVSAGSLYVGRHVGEDPDTSRGDETVGYIVVEAGTGAIGGIAYQAAIGSDTVLGITNNPPYSYSLATPGPTSIAAVSQTGMDGGNGGWAILYGDDATTGSGLHLAVDEDQMKDSERAHISEQVAYLIFNQCPNAAAEGQPCDDGVCSSTGECVTCNTDDDCSDGNACNGQEICNAANECDPGTSPDCDDGSECTTDSCDPASGCQNMPINCDDSNECTTDSCDPAVGCETSPVNCDDSNACTSDTCDPATGCETTPIVCDDSNACTVDSCDTALGCQTASIDCDDGNECTADSCDPVAGCANSPLTAGTICSAGMCNGSGNCVQCLTDGNCDDGDVCNGLETCSNNTCADGTTLACDDGNECTADSCDAVLGCVNDATPGATCESWGECNELAQCVYMGWCAPGGTRPGIHDGDFTIDDIDTAGDIAQISDKWCVAGNLTITKTALADLSGLPYLQRVLNTLKIDRNDSLVDLSGLTSLKQVTTLYVTNNAQLTSLAGLPSLKNPLSLRVYLSHNLVDLQGLSGNIPYLTGVEIVNNPSLISLEGLEFSDRLNGYLTVSHNEALTSLDGLNNVTSISSYVSIWNNDAMTDLSGLDSLVTVGSNFKVFYNDNLQSLQGAPNLNSVGSLSVYDNPILGVCHVSEFESQVGSACSSCTGNLACDDADACNGLETCSAGECDLGLVPDCDDANECTSDSCDAATGCKSVPVAAGTICAAGVCDETGNCVECLSDGDCEDGDACNGDETCSDNICVAGTELTCDDSNECTSDTCDPASGCGFLPVAAGTICSSGMCDGNGSCVQCLEDLHCDDGDACNGLEACSAQVCTNGPSPNCDDSNECTADTCDTGTGCANTPLASGAACTVGVCDGNGNCVECLADADCDDGNACNGLEICSSGQCSPGIELDCDDADVCNGEETCDAVAGCLNGTAMNCDDSNECTADSCDSISGCVNTQVNPGTICSTGVCDDNGICVNCIVDGDCNDGNVCTLDSCQNDQCIFSTHATPSILNNGLFSSGDLTSFAVYTTDNGRILASVVDFDTAEENEYSPAAELIAGKRFCSYGSNAGGGIQQEVLFQPGELTVQADIAAIYNYNGSPSLDVTLYVDDAPIGTHSFGAFTAGVTSRATLTGSVAIAELGLHELRLEVAYGQTAGSMRTFIDNISIGGTAVIPSVSCSSGLGICGGDGSCDLCLDDPAVVGACELACLSDLDCNDGDDCTDDVCQPSAQCVHVLDETNSCGYWGTCDQNGDCIEEAVFQNVGIAASGSCIDPESDGVFDSTSIGSKVISKDLYGTWTQRAILEFDLSAIPDGAVISAAELSLRPLVLDTYGGFELEVWGYSGDGIFQLEDGYAGDNIAAAHWVDSTTSFTVDITEHARNIFHSPSNIMGLNLRADSEKSFCPSGWHDETYLVDKVLTVIYGYCESDLDCDDKNECTNDQCSDAYCSHDPNPGVPCNNGVCDTTGQCVECLIDSDCAVQYVCSSQNQCVECNVDSDCSEDQICDDNLECSTFIPRDGILSDYASYKDNDGDGVFDEMVTSGVLDVGVIWDDSLLPVGRANLEFDIPVPEPGRKVLTAELEIIPSSCNYSPPDYWSLLVFGYVGDGDIVFDDVYQGDIVVDSALIDSCMTISIDSLDFVQQTLNSGNAIVGFSLRSHDESIQTGEISVLNTNIALRMEYGADL